MKRVFKYLFVACLFLLMSCSTKNIDPVKPGKEKKQEVLTIEPTILSEDTQEAIHDKYKEVLDNSVKYYNFVSDDSVKGYRLNLWSYRDYEWKSILEYEKDISKGNHQLGFRNQDTIFDVLDIEDVKKYSIEIPNLNDNLGCYYQAIDQNIKMEMNQECTLWLKVGFDENEFEIPDGYRDAKCNEGVALTITLLDE